MSSNTPRASDLPTIGKTRIEESRSASQWTTIGIEGKANAGIADGRQTGRQGKAHLNLLKNMNQEAGDFADCRLNLCELNTAEEAHKYTDKKRHVFRTTCCRQGKEDLPTVGKFKVAVERCNLHARRQRSEEGRFADRRQTSKGETGHRQTFKNVTEKTI
jgi:hypothetical protein